MATERGTAAAAAAAAAVLEALLHRARNLGRQHDLPHLVEVEASPHLDPVHDDGLVLLAILAHDRHVLGHEQHRALPALLQPRDLHRSLRLAPLGHLRLAVLQVRVVSRHQ